MKRFRLIVFALLMVGVFSLAITIPAMADDDDDDSKSPPACSGTIVQIALCVNGQTGEFDTLIAALSTAGLVDALNAHGQFTVFAPTDAAFTRLGLTPANIGSVPPATLTNILLYHVASGERFAKDFRRRQNVTMLNGDKILVYRSNRNILIKFDDGRARVVAGDIDATNGVIHVIDRVLLPPADSDDDNDD